jgi:hypothetical protein
MSVTRSKRQVGNISEDFFWEFSCVWNVALM